MKVVSGALVALQLRDQEPQTPCGPFFLGSTPEPESVRAQHRCANPSQEPSFSDTQQCHVSDDQAHLSISERLWGAFQGSGRSGDRQTCTHFGNGGIGSLRPSGGASVGENRPRGMFLGQDPFLPFNNKKLVRHRGAAHLPAALALHSRLGK